MDAFGVDAVLRRGHPQVIGLDVGAPGERQVVLLAVLQRDALHADPLAVLKVTAAKPGQMAAGVRTHILSANLYGPIT